MKAVNLAWCVGLAVAGGCGGGSSAPSTSGQSCAVVISGAPHGGTFESCGITKTGDGAYALSLAGLPGCDRSGGGCSAGAKLLGGGQESCAAHAIDVVSLTAHVLGVDANGDVAVAADVDIRGSF